MNKQNMILDFEDIFNTYKIKIPEKQLRLLKSRRWLPMKESSKLAKECAYLVGKVMGDGHLTKQFGVSFFGQEKEIENLKQLISKSFSLEINRFPIEFKKAWGTCFVLSVRDTLLGRLLFCLGAPMGNKTKHEFLVPNWIYTSKENALMFLKALLEDELTTIKITKKTHSVKPMLKLAKEERLLPNLRRFLNQVKQLIEKFDVKCSNVSQRPVHRYDQKTKELYFHINRNKENIIVFAKNIGFRITPEKIRKLEECVNILEKTKYNRKPFIDKLRIIELRKRGYSIRQIGRIVNLNRTSVHRVILKNNNARARI